METRRVLCFLIGSFEVILILKVLKMKKIIIILLLVTLSSCYSSKIVSTPNSIQKIINTKFKKGKNYIKANEWMVESFNSAKNVIQFSDKEEGIVKGKYLMYQGVQGTKYMAGTESYYAIITIRVKDNSVKMEISPLGGFKIIKYMGASYGFTPEQFTVKGNSLIDNFDEYLKNNEVSW